MRKMFVAALAAFVASMLFAAAPASAQFIGQPFWLADPSSTCTYPGRPGCPIVDANEPYPQGATPETAHSGDVAAATAAATLATASGKTTYINGFSITGTGATAAATVACTVTGLISGTMTFDVAAPADATLPLVPLIVQFNKPIPASATNTTIVVSCGTFGTGNLHASVNAWGFQR